MTAATSEKLELNVQERTIVGQKVRTLRADGIIPAVLYGRGKDSMNLQIPVGDLDEIYQEAGESTLVYVKVGSDSYPTIIAEVSRHPVSGDYLHADFQMVRLDEKVTAEVPLVFVGESPAVEDYEGILVKNLNEIEVEALPQDLPHEIEVDISALKEIDDHITLGQLKLEKAEFVGHEEDEIVATVQPPKSEEELEAELAEPTTDVDAVEVEKGGDEAPAEGEEGEKKDEAPAEEPAAE